MYPTSAPPSFRALPPGVQVFPSHGHCPPSSVHQGLMSAPGIGHGQGQSPANSADGSSDGSSQSPSPPHALHPHQHNTGQHHTTNPAQLNYLLAAFRVGMLAMETLARRVHDDRPQTKYARNPPYGEDVKWLLTIAVRLGKH